MQRAETRRGSRVAARAIILAGAAALTLLVLVLHVPAAAQAGVLEVSHAQAVRSCRYAAARENGQRPPACAQVLHEAQLRPDASGALGGGGTAPGGGSYQNPLDTTTFPDPAAVDSNATHTDYYAYSTGDLFPIMHSTDLIHWRAAGTAFSKRPTWALTGKNADWHPWSPDVVQTKGACPRTTTSSCYVMFYTALSQRFKVNCVAVAWATSPAGPFNDLGPVTNGTQDGLGRPVGCGDAAGAGNIDPDPFINSDGHAYLYTSSDWSCTGKTRGCSPSNATLKPTISVIPLASNLLRASGKRTELFSATEPWEQAPWAPVVEGPSMDEHNGALYLFYSGGPYTGAYGMGDAKMATPLGPATQDPDNPILSGQSPVFSPGGGSTIIGPQGGEWMLYHARIGGFKAPRQLFIDPVEWFPDGSVQIAGPTATSQSPAP